MTLFLREILLFALYSAAVIFLVQSELTCDQEHARCATVSDLEPSVRLSGHICSRQTDGKNSSERATQHNSHIHPHACIATWLRAEGKFLHRHARLQAAVLQRKNLPPPKAWVHQSACEIKRPRIGRRKDNSGLVPMAISNACCFSARLWATCQYSKRTCDRVQQVFEARTWHPTGNVSMSACYTGE